MVTQEKKIHNYDIQLGNETLHVEIGRLAELAGGAVTVRIGDTMLFCSATMNKNAREEQDFFPLSVDYEERLYAVGRIPGSFMRREGRPGDRAILISRVIDRTLRPLFPDGMINEVQVVLMSLSSDQEHQVDMIGIFAASLAIMISNIEWNGPVAGARIGLVDGELIVNPSIQQMENSRLDLRVSGTDTAINMVECGANEVDEETMLKALDLAQRTIAPLVELQRQIAAEIGKEKSPIVQKLLDETLLAEVRQRVEAPIKKIVVEMTARDDRNEALEEIREALRAEYEAKNAELAEGETPVKLKDVKEAVNTVFKEEVRYRITKDKVRPDGRAMTEIRPLSAQVGFVPRVHGSGLFQRGQTQVLTIATLGTTRDSQMLDGIDPGDIKRYMHHYNFPPYSVGETGRVGSPKRREIGHGSLAEVALVPMLPPEKDFPYTIRLVSEVMSSNGSTSMGSVCGSTLALMDAGVPIKSPVAGIAMGLIMDGEDYSVLTDIQGLEDHLGDMDFKVAGTANGITALQMDIKISGVTHAIMTQALKQALDARLHILKVMLDVLPEYRTELSAYAPRITTVKIDPEKIGALIGPGGKTVRGIQESTGVKIEIQEDGTVLIAGNDPIAVSQAEAKVRGITEDAEVGQIYTGKITRLEAYGAFVEFLPNKEGLVHVSQLADYRIESVTEEFKIGEELMVMVTDVDQSGRVRLSRQAVLESWTPEEARERDRANQRPSGGGGDRRGGGGGDRRGGGGGGDRRGGGGGGGDRS